MHITLNLVATYWLLFLGCFQSFKYGRGVSELTTSWKRHVALYGLVLIYLTFSALLAEDGLVMLFMFSGIALCFILWPLSFILGRRKGENK